MNPHTMSSVTVFVKKRVSFPLINALMISAFRVALYTVSNSITIIAAVYS
ncbi:hypothetical protein LNA02_06520 [Levilactobacillus namurensis]|nr:hypothetical protein LNA02_06520 [Levilactobacillus namurensis]